MLSISFPKTCFTSSPVTNTLQVFDSTALKAIIDMDRRTFEHFSRRSITFKTKLFFHSLHNFTWAWLCDKLIPCPPPPPKSPGPRPKPPPPRPPPPMFKLKLLAFALLLLPPPANGEKNQFQLFHHRNFTNIYRKVHRSNRNLHLNCSTKCWCLCAGRRKIGMKFELQPI